MATESQNVTREVAEMVKERTNDLFQELFVPRMERHLDLKMQHWLESIVEKKIEERFAFAIDLLKSMNPPKAKVFCTNHSDVEALIYTDGPGAIKAHCVWCIRQEAVENFKNMTDIMAGGNGAS